LELAKIHEREVELFNRSQANEMDKLQSNLKKENDELLKKQSKDYKA